MKEDKPNNLEVLIDKIDNLSFKEDSTILELGCNSAKNLFQIHDSFPLVKQLIGVDNNEKSVCEYSMLYHKRKYDIYYSVEEYLFDIYRNFSFTKLSNIEAFKEKIKIIINDAKAYLSENEKAFDLIILSDFLHMYKSKIDAIEVFRNCKNKLTQNGIIYIKVANEEHHYKDEEDRCVFKKAEILSMVQGLQIIYENESQGKIEVIAHK